MADESLISAGSEEITAQFDLRVAKCRGTLDREDRRIAADAAHEEREAMEARIEARLRTSISEEKQMRNRCVDDLVAQFQRLEEGVRQERERNAEARAEMRKALQKCDDFATLRETLLAESTNRLAESTNQQVKLEQLQRSREQAERKFDSKLADMIVRLDGEADARTTYDMKYAKQMSDFAAEHSNIQQTDLRRLEDIIAKASKALNAQAFEERGLRERAIAGIENKTLELRKGVDEVRKWRVEQYNELVFEIAKLGEMVTEEAKARQQQDQVLAGEVQALRRGTREALGAREAMRNASNEELRARVVQMEARLVGMQGRMGMQQENSDVAFHTMAQEMQNFQVMLNQLLAR